MSDDEIPLDDELLETLSGLEEFESNTRLAPSVNSDPPQLTKVPKTDPIELPPGLSEEPTLAFERLLAPGGLALIYEAEQSPFGRRVAIKCLRRDRKSPRNSMRLYREGVLTGFLDHPNIVPVYEIIGAPEAETAFVMKEIVGQSLQQKRSGMNISAESESPGRDLKPYIEILIDVCHAIEYAHSRDIIHRDLKSQNVMIGDYGEVYVIDWGLGQYVGDGESPFAERKEERESCWAGTPAYMAPEMVEGPTQSLTAETDQFLLGGVLHFIITGESPYHGDSPSEVLSEAYRASRKTYPDWVPVELAEITRRAMERAPDRRFSDVEAFRDALEGFLEHDHSRRLARRAASITDDIRDRVARARGSGGGDNEAGEIYGRIGEARFGFREALEYWEANEEARAGLQELLELGARWALERQMLVAAALFVEEMPGDSPELDEQVDQLERRLDDLQAESLFFEESPNALAVVDDGEILYVNQRLVEMFGYETDELLGETIEILIPDRHHDRHREHRHKYGEAPTPRPMGTDLELMGRTKSGSEFPVDVELNPVGSNERTLIMVSVQHEDPEQRDAPSSKSPTTRAILRSLPHAVFLVVDGRIAYANSKSVDLLEVDNVDTLLETPIGEYLDPVTTDDGRTDRGALMAETGVRHPVRLTVEETAFDEWTCDDCRIIVAEPVGAG